VPPLINFHQRFYVKKTELLLNRLFSLAVIPDVTIIGGPEQFAVVDKRILLTCQYNALPPVSEVQWEKDGTVIARNSSVEINDSRVNIPHYNQSQVQLLINATIPQDAGNYTCLVINDIGNSSDTTSMISQGVFKFTKRREMKYSGVYLCVVYSMLFISIPFVFPGNLKYETGLS